MRFPDVARAALEHLRDHDCPCSCYRCLRSYRNQRVHGLLNWRLVVPYLNAAVLENVEQVGAQRPVATTEGPEWDEARREGCGSPMELRLLRAMREAGLDEPEKQYEVHRTDGTLITIADFAYPQHRLLIYVDGLAFHSLLRQRIHDAAQTNHLQNMGYRVLRFLGPQVMATPGDCVRSIREATAT